MASEIKSGGCLCGAVRFTARLETMNFGACHCEMCRRWTGSALLAISVPGVRLEWQGAEHIAKRQSSAWAERAWCKDCGSGLYYRMTSGAGAEVFEMPIGLFDDANGFKLTNEIWIDHKPDSFAFAETDRQILTRAECLEKFALPESDEGAP